MYGAYSEWLGNTKNAQEIPDARSRVGLGRFCCSMHYQCRTSVREIVEGSSAIAVKLVSSSMTFFFLGTCWNRRSKINRPDSHARTKNPPLARSKYSWIRSSWPAACSPFDGARHDLCRPSPSLYSFSFTNWQHSSSTVTRHHH